MITKISGGVSVDDRGSVRFVNDFDFHGVKRFYQVQNHRRGFVRAWHGHLKESKFIYCPRGAAQIGIAPLIESDGGVDIGDPQKYIVSSETPTVLYVPPGHANGFKTLTDDTILIFFSTSSLEESLGDDYRFQWDCTRKHEIFWKDDYR